MTNATRVTEEFPGEGKGVLEILPNPWDKNKAMLLVEGWDECGVKFCVGEIFRRITFPKEKLQKAPKLSENVVLNITFSKLKQKDVILKWIGYIGYNPRLHVISLHPLKDEGNLYNVLGIKSPTYLWGVKFVTNRGESIYVFVNDENGKIVGILKDIEIEDIYGKCGTPAFR